MTRRALLHHRPPCIRLFGILILFVSIVVAHAAASASAPVRSRDAARQFPAASTADSSWWTELLPPTAPPVRVAFSYVRDPVRNRLIIFGGAAAPGVVFQNDTWALSLSEPPTWVELTPSGGPPPGRSLHSAIYDPVRDRIIIFGGAGTNPSPNHYMNDVWALDLSGTPQWTQIFPSSGPIPARALHSAIYDPVSHRMLVYGGFDGFTSLDDLWGMSLSGAPAWTLLTPAGAGPGARDYHRAIYDPTLNSMVLFGGHLLSPSSIFNDTWSLSLSGTLAWSQISPPDPLPSARQAMSIVYDSTRDRILVYGGVDSTGALGDAWALSLSGSPAWAQAAPTGNVPPARTAHAAVYDPTSDQMVIYGGGVGGVRLNDSWSFRWCAPCAPTAVSVFLDVADASQGVVRLRWIVPGGESALLGVVQRREEGSDWVDIAGPVSVNAPEFGYVDSSVEAGRRYAYRLHLWDATDAWFTQEGWVDVPNSFAAPHVPILDAPRPNPSGGRTTFRIGIPAGGAARLRIYDVAGRQVASILEGVYSAGWMTRAWGGEDSRGHRVSTGVYIAVLEVSGQIAQRKLLVTR